MARSGLTYPIRAHLQNFRFPSSFITVLTEGLIGTDTIVRSISRTILEGLIGTDTVAKIKVALVTLTEGLIGTDIIKVLINGSDVVWTKITKSSAAAWSKITRATSIWTKLTKN